MWKRSGQSSALDRAQALLSEKKSSRVVGQSAHGSPSKAQGTVDGSMKTRPAPQNAHMLFSDQSDLSSLRSTNEQGNFTMGTAAPKKNKEGNGNSEDVRPQSSLGGGGSRFLKKAPPPLTNSSQSPVSKGNIQLMSEARYASSSQRGSQTVLLGRLAQIESRFRSHNQPQEQAKEEPQPVQIRTTNIGVSQPPEAVTQSPEASTQPNSAHSSSDQSLKGKRFLKQKAATAVDFANTSASGSSKGPHAGVRSRSRAAGVPLGGLETTSVKVAHGVCLESDEEDVRKLLGESLNSTDNSFLRPDKLSFVKKTEKILSQKASSSAAVHPLSPDAALPLSPASPSHHSSPFRFTGQAQAHFSPSALSPSPSPPCVSSLLSRKLSSSHRLDSPQRSLSAMSGHSEVLSLDELFPVQPVSGDLHSERSIGSSEDFKLNVMTLDDLVPATRRFTEETSGKQSEEYNSPVCEEPSRYKKVEQQQQQQQQQEEEEEQEEEDDVLDYQSDFESESRTERNYSVSQVSEHLPGDGDRDEEDEASEVKDEDSDSDVSHGRTEDDYSSTFSNPSHREHSGVSESLGRSRDGRSPVTHSGQTSSPQSDRRATAGRLLKEAAVQTRAETMAYTRLTGMTTPGPSLGSTCMNPTSVALHTLSAETVQALSTYSPAAFILNELLKQQLATTRQFIESSRHLHSSLVQSLEPPNYRYTTLEDTKEYIRMHRPPKPTKKKALEEVRQGTREYDCAL